MSSWCIVNNEENWLPSQIKDWLNLKNKKVSKRGSVTGTGKIASPQSPTEFWKNHPLRSCQQLWPFIGGGWNRGAWNILENMVGPQNFEKVDRGATKRFWFILPQNCISILWHDSKIGTLWWSVALQWMVHNRGLQKVFIHSMGAAKCFYTFKGECMWAFLPSETISALPLP